VAYPDDDRMQISHETIYQAIYIHPCGELKAELTAHLRTRRTTRPGPLGTPGQSGRITSASADRRS
jgi:IS30 family transposase